MDGLSGIPGGPDARGLVGDQRVAQAKDLERKAPTNVDVAAHELEVMFSTLLVKEMRSSLPKGMFGSGPGADTFEGWFDEHMGRSLAEGGALEMAGLVKAAMRGEEAPLDPEGDRS